MYAHSTSPLSRLLVCAFLVFVQLSPATVQPAEATEVGSADFYQLGRTHYAAKRYQEAADAFQAAYGMQPLPELLQNIGAAHARLAGDTLRTREDRLSSTRRAIDALEKYLTTIGGSDASTAARLTTLRSLEQELSAETRNSKQPQTGRTPERTPLQRKPWFIAVMVTLSLAVAGGAIATGVLLKQQREPSPPDGAIVLDTRSTSLEVRF